MRWRDLLHLNETQPLPPDFFDHPRRVHFLGVGGIGMSALALLLKSRGHEVSGSDENDGAMPQKLRDAEIEVFIGHDAQNVGDAEAVFYSSAIPDDNAEFAAAKQKNLPLWHRSQLLAHFVNTAKTSIAVSGTHGKSTTSAMIAHILTECGQDPTAVLGAVYPPFQSNLRVGNPDLIVVEADESDGSFTLLKPTVAVVLNVEPEHLENYDESEEELWKAFEMFGENARGRVFNADQTQLGLLYKGKGLDFGFSGDAYIQGKNIRCTEGKIAFDVYDFEIAQVDGKSKRCRVLKASTFLTVPGKHNVANALAALGAISGSAVQIETKGIMITYAPDYEEPPGLTELSPPALQTFVGTLRRFERKGEANNIVVYDDYGHHPTEVRATLEAAREFLERPICVIFQPHRYSRTQALHREFGPAFAAADKIIITQLYSAHEEPIPGVSGRLVFDAVRQNFPEKSVFYAENLEEAQKLALEVLEPGDALLTMGAGDITKLGPRLLKDLKKEEADDA